MSALAYSTDRAGCVSHPTPTRRCTHVGREAPILMENNTKITVCFSVFDREITQEKLAGCMLGSWWVKRDNFSFIYVYVEAHQLTKFSNTLQNYNNNNNNKIWLFITHSTERNLRFFMHNCAYILKKTVRTT